MLRRWFLIATLLLIWRALLYLDLPYPGLDPVWYLSHAFSILRNEWMLSTFGHSFSQPFQLPYMYGLLSSFFFSMIPASSYSLFLWNLFLLVATVAIVAWMTQHYQGSNRHLPVIFTLMFLVSPYMYGPRPEVLNTLLLLLQVVLLLEMRVRPDKVLFVALALLSAVIGLVQPVGGIISVMMVSLSIYLNRINRKKFILYLIITGLAVLILYGPVILVDFENWKLNFLDRHNPTEFGLSALPKYLAYNPLPFLLMVAYIYFQWGLNRRNAKQEIVMLILLLIAISLFRMSYYFAYIPIYLVWRILDRGIPRISSLILIPVMLLSPIYSHYWPTIQQLENREYVETYNAALKQVQAAESIALSSEVWVPAQLAMPLIKQPGARLYLEDYAVFTGQQILLEGEDRIFVLTHSQMESISRNTDMAVEANQLIPEVSRGLISLRPPTFERGSGIGLWEVKTLGIDHDGG